MHRARFRAAVAVFASCRRVRRPGEPPATALRSTYTHGFDLSWPQCRGHAARHMPAGRPAYVILGLTHGTGHTVNPCLRSQLRWARMHHVKVGGYLVASYPTHRQRARANHGLYRPLPRPADVPAAQRRRAAGRRCAADDHRHHMRSPMVWLDVEFRHQQPWTHSNRRNRAVVEGHGPRAPASAQAVRRLHDRFDVA